MTPVADGTHVHRRLASLLIRVPFVLALPSLLILQGHVARGLIATSSPNGSSLRLPKSSFLCRTGMSPPTNDGPSQDTAGESGNDDERVVLLIGSLGLDRLLTVPSYPGPDAKVRTTAYNEVGGGNSANTACAMGRLSTAGFLRRANVRIRLLSKVGGDAVGRQLVDELHASNVDTTSPLFLTGPPGSTTAFTTVIVSEQERTRTCIHTPGTSGELSLHDAGAADLDGLFRNVVHLHSDSRHTDVSLFLAQEAKRRGVPISCDAEKDRGTKALDELIQISDILFTNSDHLGGYLDRLSLEKETTADVTRQPLPEPIVTLTELAAAVLDRETVKACVQSLQPSAFFTRWYSQLEKEVVVTQGSMGSFHYKPLALVTALSTDPPSNKVDIDVVEGDDEAATRVLSLHHSFSDGTVRCEATYRIHRSGVLQDVAIVDTTGAGDAFIGGYLMSKIAFALEGNGPALDIATNTDLVQFGLELGSFVGGRKLEGPGARSALPTGCVVDTDLGKNLIDVRSSLRNKLSLPVA